MARRYEGPTDKASTNGRHDDDSFLDWLWPDWLSWGDSSSSSNGNNNSSGSGRGLRGSQPPLWHFHRVIAGRDDNTTHGRRPSSSVGSHVLEIQSVDWLCRENGALHYTDRYELVQDRKSCVARRGFDLRLSLVCKTPGRSFDSNRDRVRLAFEFGARPSVSKGTRAVADLTVGGGTAVLRRPWQALFIKRDGPRVEVSVSVPTAAPVGLWNLSVETWYGEQTAEKRVFRAKEPIYVLFNPYHQDDPVHLPFAAGREEYVLSEVGKIYGGSHNSVQGRPWIFGQLRDAVLPAACHLLDAAMRDSQRGDPVRVARAVSALVNSADGDGGVVMGRWDGVYDDGTKPFEWTGSVPILEERMRTGRPVKYGQCWVFAGVAATICRALGLPCRCVTNYVSAHDTNASFSVDKFYDEEGEEVRESDNAVNATPGVVARSDSIWNFHVWNEVWMARRDLGGDGDYDGWQVIDATPQEESDNLYQLGPASVSAVRRGEVGLGFDAAFVFTEVNADVFVYVPDRDSSWGYRRVETNTDHVGKLIVTKALGYISDDTENDYQVLTDDYKSKEGSVEERLTLMRAVRNSGGMSAELNRYPGQKNQDVYLQMIDLDQGKYGEIYKVSLFLHNQSRETRTVRVVMSSSSVFYTGSRAHLVKKGEGEFDLGPNERETLTMEVEPVDYMPKAVEHCMFVNRFLVKVRQTGQIWHGEDDFVLKKPKLDVRVYPDTPRAHRPCRVVVTLVNPLQVDLTSCVFSAEAPGMAAPARRRFRRVKAGQTARAELEVVPWRPGTTTVVAAFNSDELYNVTGTRKVTVLG